MSNSWIFDVETSINTIVKTRAKAKLVATYPNINFTMDDAISDDPSFPTVYIHFLPGYEVGADVVGVDVNAIYSTVQCDVTVTKEQGMNGARNVAMVVLDEFKNLGFKVSSSPEFIGNTIDTKRIVFRCQRLIGCGDTF